jgi:hypothetical protein
MNVTIEAAALPGADAVAALNSVPVSKAEIEAALGHTDASRLDTSPLRVRVAALIAWRSVYDPQRAIDDGALLDAAARFPLRLEEDGFRFEPHGFQEMIEFIDEMPW